MTKYFSILVLMAFLTLSTSAYCEDVAAPVAAVPAEPGTEELFPIFQKFQESYDKINDYTAILHKEEMSIEDGKWTKEDLDFWFKKPFAIKIKWISGPKKGREALFIEGKNKNRIQIHLGGLISIVLPRVDLDPNSDLAKDESGHTIREAGLGYMMDEIIKVTTGAHNKGELTLKVVGKEGDILKVERDLPSGKGYASEKLIIYIDQNLGIPIGVERYHANGKMFGKYIYKDLKTNQGLKDSEFKL